MNKAIGLIETRGFTGLAVATDAMLKSASVELLKQVSIGGGFVTTVITGDVGPSRQRSKQELKLPRMPASSFRRTSSASHEELDGLFK
jgi:hypothetical protein